MPGVLHKQLERKANILGLKGERKRAYIYGTLDKIEKRRSKK